MESTKSAGVRASVVSRGIRAYHGMILWIPFFFLLVDSVFLSAFGALVFFDLLEEAEGLFAADLSVAGALGAAAFALASSAAAVSVAVWFRSMFGEAAPAAGGTTAVVAFAGGSEAGGVLVDVVGGGEDSVGGTVSAPTCWLAPPVLAPSVADVLTVPDVAVVCSTS